MTQPAAKLDIGNSTDKGHRSCNEDAAAVLADGRICLVADGIGGHCGGDIASRLAVEAIAEAQDTLLAAPPHADPALQQSVEAANRRILMAGRQQTELIGMGTTLTLALIADDRLYLAHVGDSRLYLWRDGGVRQLSEDHTLAAEAHRRGQPAPPPPQAGALTQNLGSVRRFMPQLACCPLRPGDRLLLCSDGLYRPLGDAALTASLGRDAPAQDLADALVGAVRDSQDAGLDNITAVVIKIH